MGPLMEKTGSASVKAKTIAALFKEVYRRGPWPNEIQCYGVAVSVDFIRKSRPAAAKNEDPSYQPSLATVAAMRQLIGQRKAPYAQLPDVHLPGDILAIQSLNALESAL